MSTEEVSTLRVPGAELYYEVRGHGPILVLLPGGNGDVASYAPVADALSDRFRVTCYERRGFARSPLDGEPPANRLEVDSADLRLLIEHLGGGPAHVLGMCAGAVVAFDFVQRYPHDAISVVAHEPPLVTVLEDAAEQIAALDNAYEVYRSDGLKSGILRFAEITGMRGRRMVSPNGELPSEETMKRIYQNVDFWFRHELREYARIVINLALLRTIGDKLVLACGEESDGTLTSRPNYVLGRLLGRPVEQFPGGHWGHTSHPQEFADKAAEVFARA